jgi:hypothetical protein
MCQKFIRGTTNGRKGQAAGRGLFLLLVKKRGKKDIYFR